MNSIERIYIDEALHNVLPKQIVISELNKPIS
jgi:hypothetical protein